MGEWIELVFGVLLWVAEMILAVYERPARW